MSEFTATLVRGVTYWYKKQKFERDIPKRVDEETKFYLEENAVDEVTDEEGYSDPKPKFRFREIVAGTEEADADVETDKQPKRGRRTRPAD